MYPRELNLDKATEERLISYIESELLNHYQERGPWMTRILQWQRDYWAEPKTKRATFPFVGASTIVIPLTAIAVEAVHARTMTTLFALNQFTSVLPRAAGWEDAARPVERFMDNEILREAQGRRRLESSILEIEKFGTGIAKVGYEKIVKTAIRPTPDGDEVEVPVTVRDGLALDSVAIGRFLMPFSANDPQSAPWCGEEHADSPYAIMQMEESGFFRKGTMKSLGAWVSQASTSTFGQERQFERSQQKLEDREPSWPNTIDWVEIWCGFNIDGDYGKNGNSPSYNATNKEIVVHYHRGARKILSVRHNWHDDLHRPYRVGNYFVVEHRWNGIGICKQNDQFQKEITTQHRQRLDNATIANMRMIKVSKLAGYHPDEPIFPGKMWFVDDMSHVDTLQFGEIYNSAYNNEQATKMYSDARTGVNETTLGMPQSGTPGTATGDLARIQESNKKFDYAYGNIKLFNAEIVTDSAVIIQQFGAHRIEYFDVVEGGNYVRAFFQLPPELIRHHLVLELNVAGQQQNKVLDRQNWVTIAQLLQQYYMGMMQLAQLSGNQELMQFIVQKGLVAGTEATRQILESFDVRNVDRIILGELLKPGAQNGNARQIGPASQSGGNIGPAAAGQVPGMDMLGQIVQALGAGSA